MQVLVRDDVHFMSVSKATHGIRKFKTWVRVNYSSVWHGAIGWDGLQALASIHL